VEDGTVRTFGVEIAPFTVEDIRARVNDIEMQAVRGDLPAACTSIDYPCPFVYLHETVRDLPDPELDDFLFRWAYYDRAEKEAKAAKAEMTDAIRDLMGNRESYDSDQWKVSIYEQAGPSKWDEKQMVADGLDPDRYRKKGSPSVRMKITVREEGDAG
jgi:hypothetical protein